MLRWSSADLAAKSGVGSATIKRLEVMHGIPSGNTKTLMAIKSTLESAGIEFLGEPCNGSGVRFKPTNA